MDNLSTMYENVTEQIERYDQVCNAGISDPEKVMPLLNIYMKLKQVLGFGGFLLTKQAC